MTTTRAVFVLGMHRSGASCLMGCLEHCGLKLEDVTREEKDWNRKGTLESYEIALINESLVGSWLQPVFDKRRAKMMRADFWRCARAYQGIPRVGLKDARFLLTLDSWLPFFPDPEFVGVYRSPRAVHESLMKRGKGGCYGASNLRRGSVTTGSFFNCMTDRHFKYRTYKRPVERRFPP
jgi:hypothetical protein